MFKDTVITFKGTTVAYKGTSITFLAQTEKQYV